MILLFASFHTEHICKQTLVYSHTYIKWNIHYIKKQHWKHRLFRIDSSVSFLFLLLSFLLSKTWIIYVQMQNGLSPLDYIAFWGSHGVNPNTVDCNCWAAGLSFFTNSMMNTKKSRIPFVIFTKWKKKLRRRREKYTILHEELDTLVNRQQLVHIVMWWRDQYQLAATGEFSTNTSFSWISPWW